ncbi:hypothetical protein [Ruminococcus sp. HUN007]|uniref:hypothetical protein n=1 Tax=Ruminococcus sp. HUN007 TaxID=1514668 RepID=UPI0018CC4142|nr:hypothetical protein [Ruminococcus sp. HUN007]
MYLLLSLLAKDDLNEWINKDSDPRKVAKKAVTNLVMEKAKDYPEPKPAFMQLEFE